ncbi:MAG: CHASE3 domain-containing protein [Candidatus Obscuribacterales bacterium]|nr:CHASE3 domain-containing protein [Candidatus Obscuribacterales bacterium]
MKRLKRKWAKMPIVLAALPVLVVIFASALTTFNHMEYTFEQKRWVLHTQEVLLVLAELESAVKDAETGQRGYLLTRQKAYLAPYFGAQKRVDNDLCQLESLVSDNPVQNQRMQDLRASIKARMALIKQTLDLQEQGKNEAALALVLTGQGRSHMERLAVILSEMEKEERSLLQFRTASLDKATQDAYLRFLILGTLTLLGFGIAGIIINRSQQAEARERRGQEIIHKVSQILVSPISIEDAIKQSLKVLCEEIGWTAASFWQPAEEEAVLSLVAFYAVRELPEFEAASRMFKFVKGQGLPGAVWEKKHSVWIENVQQSTNFPRAIMARQEGLFGAFAFPVNLGDEFIGVFELFASQEIKEDPSVIRLFEIVSTDIAQLILRRSMENQLAEAKSMLDSVLEDMGSGVIVADLSAKFLVFNPAAERIFGGAPSGKSKEDWVAEWEIYRDEGQTLCKREELPLHRALHGEKLDDLILLCRNAETPDGVWVSVNASPLRNKNLEIVGGIIVIEDISARKEAEQRVSEFYSTVSHELRTPLTSIRGALGLMEGGKAGELSARAQRLVEMGRKESERLIRLINDILDIRKIEAGKVELVLELHDSHALIMQAIDSLNSFASEREVTLKAELCSYDKAIKLDRDRFIQIVTNLISNAVKFAPPGSAVEIKSEQLPDAMLFSVIDHGEGISKADQRKLFKLFQQVDSSDNRQKEGTGLGLAICKALVEQHGGSIGVESERGQGARFWFKLPVEEEYVKLDHSSTPASSRLAHGQTVLLVEDDPSITELIKMSLLDEGFSVESVKALSEARLALERNSRIMAVVLDIGLPDGNGLELIDSLTASGRTIPVVVITAQQSQSAYSNPLLIDWIRKPLEEDRLLRAVQLCVQKRSPGPARVLIVEDDESTREVIMQELASLKIEILIAGTGEEAISKSREMNPDLIVLDLGLPGLDGFGVVTVLRHDAALKNTPLIVYTARDLNEEDKRNLSLGLTSYLTKSRTSESEFLVNVRNLLNGLLSGAN